MLVRSALAEPSPAYTPTASVENTPFNELSTAINSGNHIQINRLLNEHGNTLKSEEISSLLGNACNSASCAPVVKIKLLRLPHADLKHALQVAVDCNDMQLAVHLVNERFAWLEDSHGTHNKEMARLLIFSRRRHALYPCAPPLPEEPDLPLDRLLWHGRRDEAKKALKTLKGTVAEKWRDAARYQRLDVLRAILLLGYADRDRGFRLMEEAKITDPGIWKVMKEIPHYSPKRKNLQSLNGVVEEIDCRHISAYMLRTSARRRHAKFDYRNINNATVMVENVDQGMNSIRYRMIKRKDALSYIVANDEFGGFVENLFAAMSATNEKRKLVLMESENHVMVLALRIKASAEGGDVYVVRFYDPNITATHLRAAVSDFREYGAYGIENFLEEERRSAYLLNGSGLLFMTVSAAGRDITFTGADEFTSRQEIEKPRLAQSLPDHMLSPELMWVLLAEGFDEEL